VGGRAEVTLEDGLVATSTGTAGLSGSGDAGEGGKVADEVRGGRALEVGIIGTRPAGDGGEGGAVSEAVKETTLSV
jgi:hypothetical protein